MQNQLMELKENNNLFMMQKKSRSKRAPLEFMASLYQIYRLLPLQTAFGRKEEGN